MLFILKLDSWETAKIVKRITILSSTSFSNDDFLLQNHSALSKLGNWQHCYYTINSVSDPKQISKILVFCFCLFFLGGLHLWDIEVPRLGVKLELQVPAYTTVTAMPDLSCVYDLNPAHHNAGSLTHWVRPGIEHASSWY